MTMHPEHTRESILLRAMRATENMRQNTGLGWRWEMLEIVKEMERVRSDNNIAWMDILRFVVSRATPDELRDLLPRISGNDGRIQELWAKLYSKISTSP